MLKNPRSKYWRKRHRSQNLRRNNLIVPLWSEEHSYVNYDHCPFLALSHTLNYLALSERIGKEKAPPDSMLSVKPMLTIKDGELVPA
jgi:hypothetical protein